MGYQSLCVAEKGQAKALESLVSTAVLGAVERFDLARLDQLTRLEVVQAQKGSKTGGAMVEFLTIFSAGRLSDFQKFAKSNSGFFKANGLDQEKLRKDIRTLTLCSLATEKEVLSYDELFKALGVKNEDELEELLIEAVASQRLDASIDQEKNQVLIRRSIERQFEDDQWAAIADKLGNWRNVCLNTLNTLQPDGRQ